MEQTINHSLANDLSDFLALFLRLSFKLAPIDHFALGIGTSALMHRSVIDVIYVVRFSSCKKAGRTRRVLRKASEAGGHESGIFLIID